MIERIDRISKPGRRVFRGKGNLPRVINGLGVAIVSTPKGLMSDRAARAAGHGGEVLCAVLEGAALMSSLIKEKKNSHFASWQEAYPSASWRRSDHYRSAGCPHWQEWRGGVAGASVGRGRARRRRVESQPSGSH